MGRSENVPDVILETIILTFTLGALKCGTKRTQCLYVVGGTVTQIFPKAFKPLQMLSIVECI